MASLKEKSKKASETAKNDSDSDDSDEHREEITKGLQQEKDKFIKKHALSSHQQAQI